MKTGFLQNPLDTRDVWDDELGGEAVSIPDEFCTEGLKFEPQGSYPYCVSFAVTGLLEKRWNNGKELSQPHTFYKSGGTEKGSYFRANLDLAVKEGLIAEGMMPMPKNIWGLEKGWHTSYKRQADSITTNDTEKAPGYVRIKPDQQSIKEAIVKYGQVMVGVATWGTPTDRYWHGNFKRHYKTDNHAVRLVGWTKDKWIIFESLQPTSDFKGYHTVSIEYTFNSVYAIRELPSDWKQQRDEVRRAEFQTALDHYGKPRNFEAEQEVAARMIKEFKKFKNQSVLEAAGRFWTVLCNMVTYGGYSYKDCINLVYQWRRTGEMIFNVNKPRG